jgi:hypothetical protein
VLSVRSRIFHLSTFIWYSSDKIRCWKIFPLALALWWYLQGVLCTFLNHHGLLCFPITSRSNLSVPVKFVYNTTIILSFEFLLPEVSSIHLWMPELHSALTWKTMPSYQYCTFYSEYSLIRSFSYFSLHNLIWSITFHTIDCFMADATAFLKYMEPFLSLNCVRPIECEKDHSCLSQRRAVRWNVHQLCI